MVVSRTELQQVVEQINTKFEELENRIKELEAAEKKPAIKAFLKISLLNFFSSFGFMTEPFTALPISSNLSERLVMESFPFAWLLPLELPITINKGTVIAKAIVNTFNRKIR